MSNVNVIDHMGHVFANPLENSVCAKCGVSHKFWQEDLTKCQVR